MTLEDLADLLSCIRPSADVIVPPLPGFDCGVHKLGRDRCLVISTDPCINVPMEHFGWLLFHYSASDVSVFGAIPQFCTIELLGPRDTSPHAFRKAMRQVCAAADELHTVIITGHTGTYDGLSTVLGVCTTYGVVHQRDLITPAGAKPGQLILCTKPIGLEALTNLALRKKRLATRLFGARRARYLAKQIRMQSCVHEARLLAKGKAVSAMHDVTEGGLVASLTELADASNLGFVMDYRNLCMPPELKIMAEYFNLSKDQILSMSSTGTLLAAIMPADKERVLKILAAGGVSPRIIGAFTREKERIMRYDDQEMKFPRIPNDPYAEIVGSDS